MMGQGIDLFPKGEGNIHLERGRGVPDSLNQLTGKAQLFREPNLLGWDEIAGRGVPKYRGGDTRD